MCINLYEIKQTPFFGFYIAYWRAEKRIQSTNFASLFDFMAWVSMPWMVDVPWVIYKQRKFIGRSATYLGV